MYPIVYEFTIWPLEGLEISSYGVMMVIAFLLCNYLLKKDLAKKNKDPQIADDIMLRAVIGGIIGAKLYYLIEDPNALSDLLNSSSLLEAIAILRNGLVFLGGLIGGMVSVTLYLRKHNLPWLEVADWVAPYLALGHGIGRIGCFLVGDCEGISCKLPWAVTFPANSHIIGSVHPTQLYECFLYLLVFAYLIYIRNKKAYNGILMFEYLFLVGLSRFLIEFFRVNPRYDQLFNLTGAQIISIIMMVVGTYFMYINREKLKKAISA